MTAVAGKNKFGVTESVLFSGTFDTLVSLPRSEDDFLVQAIPGTTMDVEFSLTQPLTDIVGVEQVAVAFTGNDIVRSSGSWVTDGFVIGMVLGGPVALDKGSPVGSEAYVKSANSLDGRTVTGVTATTLTVDGAAFAAEPTGQVIQALTGTLFPSSGLVFQSWSPGAAVAVPTTATVPAAATAIRARANTSDGVLEISSGAIPTP